MPAIVFSESIQSSLKDAAQKLTSFRRRAFMAKVAEDYFQASARKTETYMGWNRDTIQLGLHESRTGIRCMDHYQGRGRHNSETRLPNLEADVRSLVDGQAQADPKFKSTFLYARISARAVRDALVNEKGYSDAELPNRQTIGNLLNRMGFRLKKHKNQSL